MKRYSMSYTSDRQMGWEEDDNGNFVPSFDHHYGYASSVNVCRQYISRCRKLEAEHNPRNFRIYDHWADIDGSTGFVPCVYRED